MKELSIEQKAEAYDEAIERANNLHKDAVEMENNMITKTCEIIFPELKEESEDERIRKALIKYFTLSDEHAYNEACGVSYRDIIAWLEKQGKQPKKHDVCDQQGSCVSPCPMKLVEKHGEQKPAEWIQELESKLSNATPEQLAEWKEKYFKVEPAEWSEEDEKMRAAILQLIIDSEKENGWNCVYCNDKEIYFLDIIVWLKFFIPQSHWKPTDEQINLLEELVEDNNQRHFYNILRTLYEQLKKLRKE